MNSTKVYFTEFTQNVTILNDFHQKKMFNFKRFERKMLAPSPIKYIFIFILFYNSNIMLFDELDVSYFILKWILFAEVVLELITALELTVEENDCNFEDTLHKCFQIFPEIFTPEDSEDLVNIFNFQFSSLSF